MIGLTREQVPVAIEGGGVEFRKQSVGDMSVAFVRAQQGTDLRPALKGLAGDLCQCPHWGYVLKGKVRMHTNQDTRTMKQGRHFTGHRDMRRRCWRTANMWISLRLTS